MIVPIPARQRELQSLPTSSPRTSISPVCSPARRGSPICRDAAPSASAQRTPRPGPSNVARMPSPVLFTSLPRCRSTVCFARRSCASSSSRQRRSPISIARVVEFTISVNRTVASTRSASSADSDRSPVTNSSMSAISCSQSVIKQPCGRSSYSTYREPGMAAASLRPSDTGHDRVGPAVQHQGRDPDVLQDRSNVDAPVHQQQGFECAGAAAHPLELAPGSPTLPDRRSSGPHASSSAPSPSFRRRVHMRFELGFRYRIARPNESPGQHEVRYAIRVCRRKQRAHGASLGHTHQDRSSGAHGVHDGAHIVHSLLQRGYTRNAVGKALSAFVKTDDPRKSGQTLHVAANGRQLVNHLDVRNRTGDDHEIDRPIPDCTDMQYLYRRCAHSASGAQQNRP